MSPHCPTRLGRSCMFALCLIVTGCVDPNDPAKFKPPTDDGPEATATDAAAEPGAPMAAVIPLPEDFEDEVSEEITKDNYEQALQALEQELAD